MKRTFLFNTRTALIVLLAANAANPLYALQVTTTISHTKSESSSIQDAVFAELKADGLEHEVAAKKSVALFSTMAPIKLHHLQMHPVLALTEASIVKALAKRALFDKPLDLDSYDSMTGFVQEIKGHGLTVSERDAIAEITLLNGSLA